MQVTLTAARVFVPVPNLAQLLLFELSMPHSLHQELSDRSGTLFAMSESTKGIQKQPHNEAANRASSSSLRPRAIA